MENSVFWIDLLGKVVIPISAIYLGYLINCRLKKIEESTYFKRDIVQNRFKGYQEISELLNDIFCFTTYRGHWRTLSPEDLLEKKRRLDRIFFSQCILWSNEFVKSYSHFMHCCFQAYQGEFTSAKIKSNIDRHKEKPGYIWDEEFSGLFVDKQELDIKPLSYRKNVILPAYSNLLADMSANLGGILSSTVIEDLLK